MKSFTQTHLIGQNAVDSVLLQADHPVQALELVVLQLAAQNGWLGGEHGAGVGALHEGLFFIVRPSSSSTAVLGPSSRGRGRGRRRRGGLGGVADAKVVEYIALTEQILESEDGRGWMDR